MTPVEAQLAGHLIMSSLLATRGTAYVYQPSNHQGRALVFVHPLDLITLRYPNDLFAQLRESITWLLVEETDRRLTARARFRKATA